MKKPLSGKKWFYAQGQSLGAKGVPWSFVRHSALFQHAPHGAQCRLWLGWCDAQLGFNRSKLKAEA